MLSNFSNFSFVLSECFAPSGIVIKEEIETNFENNEEADPSGIVVKEEIDETAGINTF